MQQPATAPVAPQPPAAPGSPLPVTAAPTLGPAVTVRELMVRRDELTTQLNSVVGRRSELVRDLRRTNPLAQQGVLDHIKLLDGRVMQIEKNIEENSNRILVAGAGSESRPQFGLRGGRNMSDGNMTAVMVVFTIFVLCPIALSLSRFLWKRGSRPAAAPVSRDADLRMERVEQAVDAIAVEVERISEGQRFVTQLLSKPAPASLGVGQSPAEPMRVPVGEPVAAGAQRRL